MPQFPRRSHKGKRLCNLFHGQFHSQGLKAHVQKCGREEDAEGASLGNQEEAGTKVNIMSLCWILNTHRINLRLHVTIPAVTPTFSSPSCPAASPEVPRDTSSSHMPLGSHMIHPCAPLLHPMP